MTVPGRRERKKLATRVALREAAVSLALKRGVDNVTVSDITEAADVSRRTFFNYFATKEDALVGNNPEMLSALRRALRERPPEEEPLPALRIALGEVVSEFITEADRRRLAEQHQLIASHSSLLARHHARYAALEQMIVDGLVHRGAQNPAARALDPPLLAAVVVAAVRVMLRRWSDGEERDLQHGLDHAFTLLERVHFGRRPYHAPVV